MFYNYGGLYRATPFDNSPNFNMDYWTQSLFQRLTAIIDFENLPNKEEDKYKWDKDALKFGLFMCGYLAVFKSKTYGVVPQPAALTGFGLQFQPASAIINTPYFQFEKPLRIGLDCELLKITPDYSSLFPIITKYAAELKEIDTSIKSSARNSRLAYGMIATNDKTARTLKAIRERVINGEDVIIDDKLVKDKVNPDQLPWFQFDRDVKNNYLLGELLEARRTTLVDFYREIGVRMIDDKKERMITSEVDAGNAENFIRSEVWIETLKESCEKINNMFGTEIKPILNMPDKPKNNRFEALSGGE